MTNLSFADLDQCFREDNLTSIEHDTRGVRYLKLRSMSRSGMMIEFCKLHDIDITKLPSKQFLKYAFESTHLDDNKINSFINNKYQQERQIRAANEEHLIDQLSRLQHFDWGGSFGNSLEKNIVDNYVKKIQSYEKIYAEIEDRLLSSLKGYTLNSWYNHWTSILIEDIFKDHRSVLPTIGLVKKIDFFISDIPFDLKVTYFPEQLFAEKLSSSGFGVELTQLKKLCKLLGVYIPKDLKDKELKLHLYQKISEDPRREAKEFMSALKRYKRNIITEAQKNPADLKKWFYENQGEARFDASNRFFLVLIDETDTASSWKLKRNIAFLREQIHSHLDNLTLNMSGLNTTFHWKKNQKDYHCKSDILFIVNQDPLT